MKFTLKFRELKILIICLIMFKISEISCQSLFDEVDSHQRPLQNVK